MTIHTDYYIKSPKYDKTWKVYLFGLGGGGITVIPQEGKVPNWFWRWMQYLILGNEWVKQDDKNEVIT